jgi:hypothetical protein
MPSRMAWRAVATSRMPAAWSRGSLVSRRNCPTLPRKGALRSAEARTLSKATLFTSTAPVTVRFSEFAVMPGVSDIDPLASPRGFAIRFGAFDAPALDIVAHSFDGFPTRTATKFGELLRAVAAAGGGKPEALGAVLASHPQAKRSQGGHSRSPFRTHVRGECAIVGQDKGPRPRCRAQTKVRLPLRPPRR